MNAAYLQRKFEDGLGWEAYLATDGAKAESWRRVYEQVDLAPGQRALLAAFARTMNVLCVSGIWCGDCAQQGPLLQRIADASPRIDFRFIDRDKHLDLAERVRINAGLRVPVVIFMAEDFEPVAIAGDRALTRYRAMAARALASACPIPGAPVPALELQETLGDWLDEFERVHLLLRLSGRLRQAHGD